MSYPSTDQTKPGTPHKDSKRPNSLVGGPGSLPEGQRKNGTPHEKQGSASEKRTGSEPDASRSRGYVDRKPSGPAPSRANDKVRRLSE